MNSFSFTTRIEVFPLARILQMARLSASTGVLRVVSGIHSGRIELARGHLVGAWSSAEHISIGHILVQRGHVTGSNLEKALAAQHSHTTWTSLGRLLVDMGYVSQTDLEEGVREQIRSTAVALLRWNVGHARFESTPPMATDTIRVSVEDVLEELKATCDVRPNPDLRVLYVTPQAWPGAFLDVITDCESRTLQAALGVETERLIAELGHGDSRPILVFDLTTPSSPDAGGDVMTTVKLRTRRPDAHAFALHKGLSAAHLESLREAGVRHLDLSSRQVSEQRQLLQNELDKVIDRSSHQPDPEAGYVPQLPVRAVLRDLRGKIHAMRKSGNPRSIAAKLLDFLGADVDASIFFGFLDRKIEILAASGSLGADLPCRNGTDSTGLELTGGAFFAECVQRGETYWGPALDEQLPDALSELIGERQPTRILILPIMGHSTAVGVVYADVSKTEPATVVPEALEILAYNAGSLIEKQAHLRAPRAKTPSPMRSRRSSLHRKRSSANAKRPRRR